MKEVLRCPDFIKDAKLKNGKKAGLILILEILVFLAVFVVSEFAIAIGQLPIIVVIILFNDSFRNAVLSGNTDKLQEVTNKIFTNNVSNLLLLFLNVFIILVVCLFCKLIQKRKMNTLGFIKKGLVKEYIIGVLAGFSLFSIAVGICLATGSLKIEGISDDFSIGIFILFILGFMIQGLAEEVICRGYMMVSVARRYSLVTAIVTNALVFAALHLANGGMSVLAFINLTLFGIFASLVFIQRGSIWMIGAIHSIWNLVQGNFYGIRVSGIELDCTVFNSKMISESEIWNGGEFGLEGGLGVTIVLLIGIIIMVMLTKKDKKEIIEEK